ncbi:hypothetical protein THAOC_27993, partial [Thalassiosira oceanica]
MDIPRGSGKTTWEPTSTSTSIATPCFHAEISGSEPPGTPQIQQVYGAMNPLLAYTLALMHLPAFHIPRASGKTTWESTSTSTSTTTLHFSAEISLVEQPGTPQIQWVYGAMNPLLAYTLAPLHLPAFYIPRGNGKTTWEPTSTSTSTATPWPVEKQPGNQPLSGGSGEDETNLGRWTWMRFKGEGKNVRVITAYRPVKSSRVRRRGADLTDRLGTVWEQHVRHFGDTDVDPRKRFDEDLLTELSRWKDEGDEIILMMDANQHIYDGKLGRSLRSDLQLVDAYYRMYDDHAPNSHHTGTIPIAGIFTSPG